MTDLHAQARAIRDRVARNLKFGIARGLTNLARDAAKAVTDELPNVFENPTPFTQRSIGFASATRSSLEARVFVRDVQARYLEIQEEGGERTPWPGNPITMPVRIRKNVYGNIARGAIGRQRAKPETFFASGRGRTAHLAPGLYERPKQAKRRRGTGSSKGRKAGRAPARSATGLKLLVAFKPRATYAPRFGFRKRVEAFVKANSAQILGASIADAMRTMR